MSAEKLLQEPQSLCESLDKMLYAICTRVVQAQDVGALEHATV